MIPENTAPVGSPGTPWAGCPPMSIRVPEPVYTDVDAVPLFAIHHGVESPRASPQVFCRFASVTGAMPGTSEASGVMV